MQDEALDDIIREAAEAHQPAFDDKAWEAMRHKLDAHLPQKTRKQRYLLVFLLCIVGLGTGYWLLRPGIHKALPKQGPVQSTVQDKQQMVTGTNNTATGVPLTDTVTTEVFARDVPAGTKGVPIKVPSTSNSGLLAKKNTANNHSSRVAGGKTSPSKQRYKQFIGEGSVAETADLDPVNTQDRESMVAGWPLEGAAALDEIDETTDISHLATWVAADTVAKPPAVPPTKGTDAPKNKGAELTKRANSFGGHWVGLVGVGADLSYLRLSNTGKTTLLYGVGLGYSIGKRWMVRAGIYSVEKIYAGGKDDYTLPPPAANNPYLYQINGRCRVYEIPVGISYYFGPQKKHRWFVAAGLASLIMKSESYDYLYKNASGVTYTRSYGVKNVNKHYFSVLSLSGGYQYNLSNRFALLGEPYVRLPLSGVGLGKVKLQSMGLMVTAAFRPFGKK